MDLCDEINIPGYEVVTEPENKDISHFHLTFKEAKKPVVLAGAGINQSKSNQLLDSLFNKNINSEELRSITLKNLPYEDTLFLRYCRYAWFLC